MDRCPNCGSSVRIGAKFCTTCGFRLPALEQPKTNDAPSRSPFATTSASDSAPSWGQPAAAVPATPEPDPEPDVAEVATEAVEAGADADAAVAADTTAEATPAVGAEQPAAPFTGWPAYGTGFGPRSNQWTEGTPMPDAPPVPQEQPQSVEDVLNAWTASVKREPVEETADLENGNGSTEPRPNPWLNAATATAFVVADDDEQANDDEVTTGDTPESAESDAAAAPDRDNETVIEATGEVVETASDEADDALTESAADAPGESDDSAEVGFETIDVQSVATDAVDPSDAIGAEQQDVDAGAELQTADVQSDSVDEEDIPDPDTDDAIEDPDTEPEAAVQIDEAGDIELDGVLPTPSAESVAASIAVGGSDAATDPAARAAALVAELQALLPSLTAAGSPAIDMSSALELLEAARAQGDTEAETFQSLRAAIATAQARPRDIDVMMDLVSRAGAINDVIAAYDRDRGAILAAIATLKGETAAEPAPRW